MEAPLPPLLEEAPDFCPMHRFEETIQHVREEYEKPSVREFARLASIQEAECYEMTPDGLRTKYRGLKNSSCFLRNAIMTSWA